MEEEIRTNDGLESGEVVELDCNWAVVDFPDNAIEAKLIFKIYHNGAIREVSQVLNMKDVQKALKRAEDGYIDEDDRFVLTEKGEEYLRERGVLWKDD